MGDSFPLRWKLFKHYLKRHRSKMKCYLVRNHEQVDEMIEEIKPIFEYYNISKYGKEILKVGNNINFKFNTDGLEYDLIPGTVYNIIVDRYTDTVSLQESGKLPLPSKVYCTSRDERFIDKVVNSYNLSESGFTGVMLAGLKGSGKTVMAKMIANKSGLPIVNIDKTYVHISFEIL